MRAFLRPAAAAALALACVTGTASASALTRDPAADQSMSPATWQACQLDPSGSACQTDALADINAARASEGIAPMVLPSDWTALTGAQQLLVVANLERVARGLIPALGLSAALNRDAAAAVTADEDPMPTDFLGTVAASNWAGGLPSTLQADFEWMYDDGYGSGNEDCTSPTASACWGHRNNILYAFESPLVMGAASGSDGTGPSMAELFIGGDQATGAGQHDAPQAPTWATISGGSGAGGATGSTPTSTPTSTSTTSNSSANSAASTEKSARATSVLARPKITVRSHAVRSSGRRRSAMRVTQVTVTVTGGQTGHRIVVELRRGQRWVALGSGTLDRNGHFSFRIRTRRSITSAHLRVILPA